MKLSETRIIHAVKHALMNIRTLAPTVVGFFSSTLKFFRKADTALPSKVLALRRILQREKKNHEKGQKEEKKNRKEKEEGKQSSSEPCTLEVRNSAKKIESTEERKRKHSG